MSFVSSRVMAYENVLIQFGKKLKQIRKGYGLSQEAFAAKVGLHFTYIGQAERGKRNVSLKNIYRIAKALSVPSSKLLPF